jgi:sugar lactone lactonase YvrE
MKLVGMRVISTSVLLLSLAASARSSLEIVRTAAGCEDFAFDKSHTSTPRLIVSCDDRRDKKGGGLYTLDLVSHEFRPYPLSGIRIESLHPHGIYLLEDGDTSWLYVINHQNKKENSLRKAFTQILVFEVGATSARFVEDLGTAEGAQAFRFPNDLFVQPNGDVYLANSFSLGHSLLRYSAKEHRWSKAAGGFLFANGVHVKNRRLYLHGSVAGKQIVFDVLADGTLANRQTTARKLGAVDNITENAQGDLLFSGATTLAGYLRYYLNPSYDPQGFVARDRGGRLERLDLPLRDVISAPSVAFEYGDRLYLGQVFEDFIAVIKDPVWVEKK